MQSSYNTLHQSQEEKSSHSISFSETHTHNSTSVLNTWNLKGVIGTTGKEK